MISHDDPAFPNRIMVSSYGRNLCRTRQGFTKMPISCSDPSNILRSSGMVTRNL